MAERLVVCNSQRVAESGGTVEIIGKFEREDQKEAAAAILIGQYRKKGCLVSQF